MIKLIDCAEHALLYHAQAILGDVRTWAQPSFGAEGGVFWERMPTHEQLMAYGDYAASYVADGGRIDWHDRKRLHPDDWILVPGGGAKWLIVIREPRPCPHCGARMLLPFVAGEAVVPC